VSLFVVPIRTVSPSKSWVEISVSGEDCDTIADIVFQQYLTT
jgi:hypothetical protein